MARRLFSTQIVDSDAFLDMPASAQNLYFHLGMRADDDGFVGNPKKILRVCGANEDDLKVLVGKRFVLTFKSGVVVIKHWLIHNSIRKDRYNPTQYLEEKNSLRLKENNSYTDDINVGLPLGNQTATQVKLSKVKLSKEKIREEKGKTSFSPPSLDEIKNYCLIRKNSVDPDNFLNFYESKGWFVGKNKMKSWQAAVRTWENRDNEKTKVGSEKAIIPSYAKGWTK